MSTPQQVAEAFSGHRFAEAYDALAPDVTWSSSARAPSSGGTPSSRPATS
ncbi:hypothetical protein [Microlunatus flavus]|uniref:SnoaL-like domain-containing protein n=1 Tax=Microlunatus flavus TaxID=1036181 RepID=A0A1H9BYU5_9ACTN|nr:hypothetical protein [Microlunatus flavus]SEP93937.1 hypothetical protein SAMN05421756_1023 [Microlunatus flavus]